MKRCALSMLEMCEVEEMREFGEVLEVMGRDGDDGAGGYDETAGDKLEDEDDFFLIDTSERSEDAKGVEDIPLGGYLQTSMNRMSRSTSMLSFSTASKQQDLCLSSMMALPNIVEETGTASSVSVQSPKNDNAESNNEVKSNTDPSDSVHCKQHAAKTSTKTTAQSNEPDDLDQSTTSLTNTKNAPLRSSFKRKDSSELDRSTTSVSSNIRSSIKSTDSSNDNKQLKRNVSFASLEIRSYNVTLGDAPTSHGPPVSLDWDYDPKPEVIPLDSYEEHRERRSRHEMLMPASHRKYLLMREAGFSRSEIQRAVEDARQIVKGRERTRKNLCLMPVEEAWEGTKRKFGKLVRRNSREKI